MRSVIHIMGRIAAGALATSVAVVGVFAAAGGAQTTGYGQVLGNSQSRSLAFTGNDVGLFIGVAAAAILLGAALVLGSRRSSSS